MCAASTQIDELLRSAVLFLWQHTYLDVLEWFRTFEFSIYISFQWAKKLCNESIRGLNFFFATGRSMMRDGISPEFIFLFLSMGFGGRSANGKSIQLTLKCITFPHVWFIQFNIILSISKHFNSPAMFGFVFSHCCNRSVNKIHSFSISKSKILFSFALRAINVNKGLNTIRM